MTNQQRSTVHYRCKDRRKGFSPRSRFPYGIGKREKRMRHRMRKGGKCRTWASEGGDFLSYLIQLNGKGNINRLTHGGKADCALFNKEREDTRHVLKSVGVSDVGCEEMGGRWPSILGGRKEGDPLSPTVLGKVSDDLDNWREKKVLIRCRLGGKRRASSFLGRSKQVRAGKWEGRVMNREVEEKLAIQDWAKKKRKRAVCETGVHSTSFLALQGKGKKRKGKLKKEAGIWSCKPKKKKWAATRRKKKKADP